MSNIISELCSSNHYCNLARNIISEKPEAAIITLLAISSIALYQYTSHTPQNTLQNRKVKDLTNKNEEIKKKLEEMKNKGLITENAIKQAKEGINLEKIKSIAESNDSLTFGKKDLDPTLNFLNLDFPSYIKIDVNRRSNSFIYYSAFGAFLSHLTKDPNIELFKDVNKKSGLDIINTITKERSDYWSFHYDWALKDVLRYKFQQNEYLKDALLATGDADLKYEGGLIKIKFGKEELTFFKDNNEIGEALMNLRKEFSIFNSR